MGLLRCYRGTIIHVEPYVWLSFGFRGGKMNRKGKIAETDKSLFRRKRGSISSETLSCVAEQRKLKTISFYFFSKYIFLLFFFRSQYLRALFGLRE